MLIMRKAIEYGLDKNVFKPRALARLVYGPIHRDGCWNSRRDEYTEILSWELPNISLIPKEARKELYLKLMEDDSNQDFFATRVLCALGHQMFQQESLEEAQRNAFYWHTHYEMTDTIRQGHNTMALQEVLNWHQWGLPYAMEEVKTLQHCINVNIEYIQEFRDWLSTEKTGVLEQILAFEGKSIDVQEGYKLLQMMPLDIMYEFLLKVYGDVKR